jgi:hypothetical protein
VLINGTVVRTKATMKVLGVTMDTALNWNEQVNNPVSNVQSKIHAVRMIQRFFMTDKILQLLKAYCYPFLYYASSIWLSPSLSPKLKSNLFSASGKILSTIEVDSYRNLHKKIYKSYTGNVAKL